MASKKRDTKSKKQYEQEVKKHLVIQVTLKPALKYFLHEHFRLLRRAGFEVTLICSESKDARDGTEAVGAGFIPVTIKQGIAPVSSIIGVLRLYRLFLRLCPTIVHSHGSKPGIIGTLAACLAKVPIRIYTNHGMALLSARGWKYWLLYFSEIIACKCATKAIFVSPSNMEDAIKIGICQKDKAIVLGPGTISGLDIDKFDPVKNAARGLEMRRKVGIPDDSWLVGFVGRIVAHKGVKDILEAWCLLPAEIRSNAYLCMFGGLGEREMYNLVEQAVSDPDLHVKYMGVSNDLPAWYSTMTLLVQPSWHEGWGYNVLEAACNGVPAVGTRISATVDAILDGQTGLLVPVKDPREMAKAITKLLKDSNLRQVLGRAARERTIKYFSRDKICPLLVDEYQRLLREKNLRAVKGQCRDDRSEKNLALNELDGVRGAPRKSLKGCKNHRFEI